MSLLPHQPDPNAPPPGYKHGDILCDCDCHYNPAVKHIIACCGPKQQTKPRTLPDDYRME